MSKARSSTLPLGSQMIDAQAGHIGLTLRECIGAGGMATVYLGEYDGKKTECLLESTPRHVAIKVMHLKTARALENHGFNPAALVKKEVAALKRAMSAIPLPENIVAIYGSGTVSVDVEGEHHRLPWIALEYVDGCAAGATLLERVQRSPQGMDPERVYKLTLQVLAGLRVLHQHGVIHRDIKPENIFMTGSEDDENAKIGDCGIARIEGATIPTVPAMSPQYAAPEQYLSTFQPTTRNPLIGPWTDVHAFSALAWFIIAGEDWRVGSSDVEWRRGARRPVRSGERVHPGFMMQPDALEQIDDILRIGTAHGLPDLVWQQDSAQQYRTFATAMGFENTLWTDPRRYESLEQLELRLVPLLRRCSETWASSSVRKSHVAVMRKPTLPLQTNADLSLVKRPAERVRGLSRILALEGADSMRPGNAAFQPDGRVLARFGNRVVFYMEDRAMLVDVPAALSGDVARSKWVTRAPSGGFALVSDQGAIFIQHARVWQLGLPRPTSGDGLGPVQAAFGDGSVFGLITGEVDFKGGPELWLWTPEEGWRSPIVLPMAGDARFIAATPYGYLCVGAHPSGKGRAALLDLSGQAVSYLPWLTGCPPLDVAAGGVEREFWVAGGGKILRLSRAGADVECSGYPGDAVAMTLDPMGHPWLVTSDIVLRRHATNATPTWLTYETRETNAPPFVAIGCSSRGVDILDARGSKRYLRPPDVDDWIYRPHAGRPRLLP